MATDAFIGLGSNLENPMRQLAQAIARLAALPKSQLIAQSPFYASRPVGPQDQPDFINGAVWLSTDLRALALLDELQAIEQSHGRIRERHWGPRTLDLDLLLFGNEVIQTPRLTVPHAYLHERDFALQPLLDLNSELALPDGTALRALRKRCPDNHLRQLSPSTSISGQRL